MSTDISENGLESLNVRHMTGTDGLVARHVGAVDRLVLTSRFG
jgi:hypothetical protein